MKRLKSVFPVILMIWPYVFLLFVLLPDETGKVHGLFLAAYSVLTVLFYCLNIWNAFAFQGSKRQLAYYDMAVKLLHIPFYLGVFVIGIISLFVMVVPVFLFLSPILMLVLAGVDFFLMLTSSMYGISAVVRLLKEHEISKKSAVFYILCHVVFVADVISAVCLYRKCRDKEL